MRRRNERAFTLIEILLVVVIIGILAALVVPKLTGRSEDAKISAAKQDLATLRDALMRYEMDNGNYPSTEQGLEALVTMPNPQPKNWKDSYLMAKQVPLDPWGNRYVYRFPGSTNPKTFDLICMGPDGQEGTVDDIDALNPNPTNVHK